MAGTILAVPAIGLTAIFAVLRFANFALASHATIGAFAGLVANVTFGMPVVPSLGFAFLVAGSSANGGLVRMARFDTCPQCVGGPGPSVQGKTV